jgi:hypothetical protein
MPVDAGGGASGTCDGVDAGAPPPDSGTTAPTQSDCNACIGEAGANACDSCICQHCLGPDVQCANDAGCGAIDTCAANSGCASLVDCYTPSTCQSVIDQYGGPSGSSAQHLRNLNTCAMGACKICQQ